MGRRKTNLKKKKAAKRQKQAMEHYRKSILKQCVKDFIDMLKDETAKQEAYRWN